MNSLNDLNDFSLQRFTYTDQRPVDVIWSDAARSQSYSVDENDQITVVNGGRMLSMANQPEPLRYTIDLVNAPAGTTISWGNLTALGTGNLVANNQGTAHTVYGIQNLTDWELVKNPVITPGANPEDTWFFTGNVRYNTGTNLNYYAWNNIVNVYQLDELSAGSLYYYVDGTQLVTNTPTITPLSNANLQTGTYTLTITPTSTAAFGNITSTGNTATTSFNNTTKVYTIAGTRANVNSHLANLTIFPQSAIDISLNLNYSLYNATTAFTSTSTQPLIAQGNTYMGPATPTYYDRNTISSIQNTPYIFDIVSNTAATYNLKITSLEANAVSNVFSNATQLGGTSQYFTANDTAIITGNKDTVNRHLGNLFLQAEFDYTNSFNLLYTLTVPGGNVTQRLQPAFLGNSIGPISNIAVNRTFVTNDGGQNIWPTQTPFITETLPGYYTFTLSSNNNIGVFGYVTGGNTEMTSSAAQGTTVFSVSGYRDSVNQQLALIRFSPYKNIQGPQTMRYRQYYTTAAGTTLQLDQTIGLTGQTRSGVLPTTEFLIQNQQSGTTGATWNQANYMLANIVMVGAGSGAGNNSGGSGGNLIRSNAQSLLGNTAMLYSVGRGGINYNQNVPPGTRAGGSSTLSIAGGAYTFTATGGAEIGFYGTGANGSPTTTQVLNDSRFNQTVTITNTRGVQNLASPAGVNAYYLQAIGYKGTGGPRLEMAGAVTMYNGFDGVIYIKFYE